MQAGCPILLNKFYLHLMAHALAYHGLAVYMAIAFRAISIFIYLLFLFLFHILTLMKYSYYPCSVNVSKLFQLHHASRLQKPY